MWARSTLSNITGTLLICGQLWNIFFVVKVSFCQIAVFAVAPSGFIAQLVTGATILPGFVLIPNQF